ADGVDGARRGGAGRRQGHRLAPRADREGGRHRRPGALRRRAGEPLRARRGQGDRRGRRALLMAVRIVMPTFGMYTAEGVLARWLVEPGARVEAGDLVAEITTEKASYDLEAPASGVLHQVASVGDPLAIEGLIG